jgi:hypothetical protein
VVPDLCLISSLKDKPANTRTVKSGSCMRFKDCWAQPSKSCVS